MKRWISLFVVLITWDAVKTHYGKTLSFVNEYTGEIERSRDIVQDIKHRRKTFQKLSEAADFLNAAPAETLPWFNARLEVQNDHSTYGYTIRSDQVMLINWNVYVNGKLIYQKGNSK